MKNHTGIGRPRNMLLPSVPNPIFTERIVPAFEKYWMSDLKIDIVPNVTMNGAILNFATITPFNAPSNEPKTKAKRNVSTNASVESGPNRLRKKIETPPTNAAIDPTERSIPPLMMTNVIPSPIIPVYEICRRILVKFRTLRKFGQPTIVAITNKTMNAIPNEWSLIRKFLI
jgi:hypothetical protein